MKSVKDSCENDSKEKGEWIHGEIRHFSGATVITDPCYLGIGDPDEQDRLIPEWGGLISRTFYGDWGCTIYKKTDKEVGEVEAFSENQGHEVLGRFRRETRGGVSCHE